ATGMNDGTSWYDAFNDLQDALQLARTDSAITEVWVADGSYSPASATGARTAAFDLPDGVGVYGGFGGLDCAEYYNGEWERVQRDASIYEAILTGDLKSDDTAGGDASENCYHVVTARLVGATTTLDGFTIMSGNANGLAASGDNTGGGILIDTASPILARLIVKNNKATGSGGAIYVRKNSDPNISDCVFLGNTSSLNGGGVYNLGNGTFKNCAFIGNRSNGFGGGIINQDNTAVLLGCLFSGNRAGGAGGGSYNAGSGTKTYINCTFGSNIAVQDGGGIATVMSTVGVSNSILWGNTDRSGTGEIAQLFRQGGNLTVDYSCIRDWTRGGTKNMTDDPQFVLPLGVDGVAGTADDNLRLAPGSPCLDAGNTFALFFENTLEKDLDGAPRIQDDPCAYNTGSSFFFGSPVVDMGAYEHFYPSTFTNKVVYVSALATGNN
ncbi:MAG TPA: right-handed parallel beta-helix repeat-containing protein, partial [bacterium]|nr:right-handed parallel beta-helix repeat-containing protein [bacterium]